MSAVYVSNIIINQGATFEQTFDLIKPDDSGPLDLTEQFISSQLRKHAGSNTKISFTTTKTDAVNGQLKISLTSTQTTNISKPGRYVYDIILYDNETGKVSRVVEGSVLVREGVTR